MKTINKYILPIAFILPAFSSGANAQETLSATISWEIPTTRVNGDALPLSSIGGYQVLFRQTNQTSYAEIMVYDEAQTSLSIDNIESGEYEFLIASFDTDDIFSAYSSPYVTQLGDASPGGDIDTGGSTGGNDGSVQIISAELDWAAPTTRRDGQQLSQSEIGGYQILYRKTDEMQYTEVNVADRAATSHLFQEIQTGEYEFMIASYDTDDVFSEFSAPMIVYLDSTGSTVIDSGNGDSTDSSGGTGDDTSTGGTTGGGDSTADNGSSNDDGSSSGGNGSSEPTLLSAEVDWTIPTTRENGDELLLSEIGGYHILYRRTDEMQYTEVVITDQTMSNYIIQNLEAGEYEFLITSFDTDNQFSAYSTPYVTQISM
ncbi:fibronectin type III domain-containing protein [Teredinibacter sp. KSP-S5-2]|uniref:fibronectin type III domain-containing protein n=1 Tax=Teredinibacter sp. KSP-S5-2 TaxID=3034506 RepID=UPI0029343171|nr:fibronectin type III domain-containing protein [Teredinibacter sp. KSP-S5-2]WNO10123.1 fibronectin type III domain-containing protein [Teredinibacter sp. KSP-S5-2]